MTAPELTCDVCDDEPAVGVAAMPGVPASFAYGRGCLEAGAHPYGMVVANTALCGGLAHAADWWVQLVTHTLEHLGVGRDKFAADVADAIRDMDAD